MTTLNTTRLDFADLRGDNLDGVVGSIVDMHGLDRFLLIGPPGVGKTMLVRRVPGLLGPLSDLERTWITEDYRSLGALQPHEHITERPFRAPHHTISAAAFAGTVTRQHTVACRETRQIGRCNCDREPRARPGEAQLGRFGVLYLDDLPEFSHATLDALVSALDRMGSTAPRVIASANPCPCGWKGSTVRACECTAGMLDRWDARLNAARRRLMIDEEITVPTIDMRGGKPCRSTAQLRAEYLAKCAACGVTP